MVPMSLTPQQNLLLLALFVAIPLIDWLWRVTCPLMEWLWRVAFDKRIRMGWPSDQQMMVVALYVFLLSCALLVTLGAISVANRLNLIYSYYQLRLNLYLVTGALTSSVLGVLAAILCRYFTHAKPRPMHGSNHYHAKQRWYAYQLEHIGRDQYALHFNKANRIHMRSKCDVSLKVYPDIALTAILDLLGPGKTLCLTTPNADLYWAVKRQRSKLESAHPQIRVKPYATPLNCIIGAYGSWTYKWGIPLGKAVISRGYTINT
ncbi:hypothetical protein XP4B_13205 [Xanthomonas perforans]|uniref:Uncharacterized protein n=2 Tax=Xanthomonas TaxID=338 RepID=A0ABR5EM11_XANPE|nr:hypothetical protein XP315_20540 [Xanthomonas perforans]KLC11103.1 hypothetical protein XP4B_13205 [Xanthomonas perforans]KLC58582.1 hypothetical protein GEV839_21030 [Xanthomonas perforans]